MSFLHEIETFCRGFQDQWHALLVNAALKVLAFDIEGALKKTARDTYLPFDLLKTKNQEEIVSKKIRIQLSSPRMKKIQKLNPSCKRTKQTLNLTGPSNLKLV